MHSKFITLNVTLSISIILILIYFLCINYSYTSNIDGFKKKKIEKNKVCCF